MLLYQHAASQCLGGIVAANGHASLDNGWSAIELLGDEVYRCTVFGIARVKRTLMSMQSWIFR